MFAFFFSITTTVQTLVDVLTSKVNDSTLLNSLRPNNSLPYLLLCLREFLTRLSCIDANSCQTTFAQPQSISFNKNRIQFQEFFRKNLFLYKFDSRFPICPQHFDFPPLPLSQDTFSDHFWVLVLFGVV